MPGLLWVLLLAGLPLAAAAGTQALQDLAVLADPSGHETIDTVSAPGAAGRFTPLPGSLQAGYTRQVHWLRFTLPADDGGPWWLEVLPAFLDDLRLYEPDGAGFIEHHTGDTLPRSTRDLDYRNFVFKLQQPHDAGTARTAYLRLQTTSTSSLLPQLWRPDEFPQDAQKPIVGIGLGLALMTALANLAMWLKLRERLFGLFSLYAFANTFSLACTSGLTGQYLLPAWPAAADFAVSLSVGALSTATFAFLMYLVGLPRRPGDRRGLLQGLIAAPLLLLPAAHLAGCYPEVAPVVVALLVVVLQPWLLWMGWRGWWVQRPKPLSLLVALCAVTIPMTLRSLAALGWSSLPFEGTLAQALGNLVVLLFMTAAALERLTAVQLDRQQARAAARAAEQRLAQAQLRAEAEQAGRAALQRLLTERDAALADLQQAQWLGRIGHWTWARASDRLVCAAVVHDVLEWPPGRDDLHGRDLQSRLPPADWVAVRSAMRQALAIGTPYRFQLALLLPSGQPRWVDIQGAAPINTDGGRQNLHGTLQDVTIRHLAQQAALDQRSRFMALRAKNELLAKVSHEMRTPLNAVLGFTELLALDSQVQALPPAREKLALIHGAAQHLQVMIDDVLDLAQVQAGRLRLAPAALPVAPLVDESLRWLATLAEQRQVTVRRSEIDPDWHVQADRNRLRQVLLNLLRNAIQYNHADGDVSVQVQHLSASSAAAGQVRIAVHDTGPGLTEAQLGELFTPFNRIGPQADANDGAGLGLSVSHALVEAMGGQLQVTSTPGQGSVFAVCLPVGAAAPGKRPPDAPVPRPQAAATNDGKRRAAAVLAALADARALEAALAPPAAAPLAQRTVLCIDDNRLNLAVLRQALQRLPQVQALLASSGPEGLALARAQPPDLVLLDINMPGMNGLAVLQHLQADPVLAGVPCVAVSANALPDDVAQALAAGFRHYLTKPYNIQRLLDLVRVQCGLASEDVAARPG